MQLTTQWADGRRRTGQPRPRALAQRARGPGSADSSGRQSTWRHLYLGACLKLITANS